MTPAILANFINLAIGKSMTLKEAVDSILKKKESKNKELERRIIEKKKLKRSVKNIMKNI